MRTIRIVSVAWFLLLFGHAAASIAQDALPKDLWDRVEHHYADSNGVKSHYAALEKGSLPRTEVLFRIFRERHSESST